MYWFDTSVSLKIRTEYFFYTRYKLLHLLEQNIVRILMQ